MRVATRAAAGDHVPLLRADAVETTHVRAVQLTYGDEPDDSQPVWLIQVEGTRPFVCEDCLRPPRAVAPTGRVMQIDLDAKTFATRDFGLVNNWLDLSRAGQVIPLRP